MNESLESLRLAGWFVQTGGNAVNGFWCQIRRDGRISHHEGPSLQEAVDETFRWALALEGR